MQSNEKAKQPESKRWFDSIQRMALDTARVYAKDPDTMEKLLIEGNIYKELYSLIYNSFVSTGHLTRIENLDATEKSEIWAEAKEIHAKYSDKPLSTPDGIKISKAVYILKFLLSHLCKTSSKS